MAGRGPLGVEVRDDLGGCGVEDHGQGRNLVCVCVCVCVREREREREVSKITAMGATWFRVLGFRV